MDLVIGVLGGMGTYATIDVFKKYAEVFRAKKEWERPRIIIDNRCTMPSRVKAFLYNEKKDQLLEEMTESIEMLIDGGCNKIILSCNTAHIFLPTLYKRIPELEKVIVDIVKTCAETIENERKKTIYLLGTEGTIKSKIYEKELKKRGINCINPGTDELDKIRRCIEAVKQNEYNDDTKKIFINLIKKSETCVLGCTELPVLYEKYKTDIKCNTVYDPILIALKKIYKENYKKEFNT